jgi:hypothetical protein
MVLHKQTRLFQQKFLLEHQYHMLNDLSLMIFHNVMIDENVRSAIKKEHKLNNRKTVLKVNKKMSAYENNEKRIAFFIVDSVIKMFSF